MYYSTPLNLFLTKMSQINTVNPPFSSRNSFVVSPENPPIVANEIYTIELFKSNTRYLIIGEDLSSKMNTIEFKLIVSPLNNDTKKPNTNKKSPVLIEYPIQIVSINATKITEGYATAYISKLHYGGKILKYIYYNGDFHIPDESTYYWFPTYSKPPELFNGSMRIYLNNRDDLDSMYVIPANSIPFMDSNGDFRYEYIVVAYIRITSGKKEYKQCKMPAIVYQLNNKYTFAVLNGEDLQSNVNTADNFNPGACYSIRKIKSFAKIPYAK